MADETLNLYDPVIPPILKSDEVFSIAVGGEVFRLSGASLSSDGPNYFTDFFNRSQNEPEDKRPILHIDRSPEVFHMIVKHLRGYHVVPEDESMYACVLADAIYYNLPRLTKLLKEGEILVRIGNTRFRIKRQTFNNPGDFPNFFTLDFAIFFGGMPEDTKKRLLRPVPLWPAEVPGRSATLFQYLIDYMQGLTDTVNLSSELRDSLVQECRFYRFRNLEQKLIPHSIQTNIERGGIEEITLRLKDIKVSEVKIGKTGSGQPTVCYKRPYVDSQERDLIFQVNSEHIVIEPSDGDIWKGRAIKETAMKLNEIAQFNFTNGVLSSFFAENFDLDVSTASLTIDNSPVTDLTNFTKKTSIPSKRKASETTSIYLSQSQWRFFFNDKRSMGLQLLTGIGCTDGQGRNTTRKFLS